MCYVVYMSTTSANDLSRTGDGHFTLRPVDAADTDESIDLLAFPHRWYLESKQGGCSCHFRHAFQMTDSAGNERTQWFGPPEDWWPEDAEDVEATGAFYDVIAEMAAAGEQVDVVDSWVGEPKEKVRTMDVSLAEVGREAFRFFENARFVMRP